MIPRRHPGGYTTGSPERSGCDHKLQIDDDDRATGIAASRTTADGLTLPARRGLPDIVAERLIEGIADGTIRPGERLVETSLAASLGVSRAPLREAFRQLEAQGLVETRNGRGTHVRHLSNVHLEQMISVRAVLEGLAARLVTTQADPGHLDVIRRIHDRFEIASRDGSAEERRRLDWEFHETICRFSGNALLLESWRLVSMSVRVFMRKNALFNHDTSSIVRNHREFVEAIHSGDGDRAERIFRWRLIQTGYRHLGQSVPAALASYEPADVPTTPMKPAREPARRSGAKPTQRKAKTKTK